MAAWRANPRPPVNRNRSTTNAADRAGAVITGQTEQAGGPRKRSIPICSWVVDRCGSTRSGARISLYPEAKGSYLVAIMTGTVVRTGLGLSNTSAPSLCRGARGRARSLWFGRRSSTTDQACPRSWVASSSTIATYRVLSRHEVTLSMDGKGAGMDNVLHRRLWQPQITEEFTCMPIQQRRRG